MDDELSPEELDEMIVMAFIEDNARFWAEVNDRTEPWPDVADHWGHGESHSWPLDAAPDTPVACPGSKATRRPARCSYDRPRRAGRR